LVRPDRANAQHMSHLVRDDVVQRAVACMFARSAVSNCIRPLAGMNAAAPALAGRRCVGPACPRIPPGPSMATADASMRTSSMTWPLTTTSGRSPTMTLDQRFAADLKAFFCAVVSPPRNTTVMVNGAAALATFALFRSALTTSTSRLLGVDFFDFLATTSSYRVGDSSDYLS